MNSGGAATNSGIDFQQRVGAYILAHVLTDLKNITAFGFSDELDILEVRFETKNSIDDLVLITSNRRVFVQAKRSLSLSKDIKSEYSAVLYQFISQCIADKNPEDMYVLVTSSMASRKIIKDLRKLTEAARLNEVGWADNPLTKAEEEVLEITYELLKLHYKAKAGILISDEDVSYIFKRIYVVVLDIEMGAQLESAITTLLAPKCRIAPAILWASLITLSLSLAKDRLSISKNALIERMGKYLEPIESIAASDIAKDFFSFEFSNSFSAGRELLLIPSFVESTDYLILELYRFDDTGHKRLKFFNNKVQMPNGEEYVVIQRSATLSGINRYIEQNAEQFLNAKMCLVPLRMDGDIDELPHPRAHAELCYQRFNALPNPLLCTHCGNIVSSDQSPVVEVDEEKESDRVGIIHNECLRPADRILGMVKSDLFKENKLLKNFDYSAWFQCVAQGQGLFASTEHLSNQVYPIAWNPDHNNFSKGAWCVRINLDDGSSFYSYERGKISRYSENEAIRIAKQFTENFEESKKSQDPWCISKSNGEAFSKHSTIMSITTLKDKILFCVSAEATKYTSSISNTYSHCKHFYAPLILLLDQNSGDPILIDGAFFLLTDPLQLENYIENWRISGIKLPEFTVSIIESDDKFDRFVQKATNEGRGVFVNPSFTMSKTMVNGFAIANFQELAGNFSEL